VPIKIPRRVIAEMITHALEKDPNECCGVLLAKGENITKSLKVCNVHENKIKRYTMDPVQFMEIEANADKKNEKIVAFYHSHTHSQGYPSATDVKNAVESGWIDPYYVLISLVEKTRPYVRAYRIDGDSSVNEIVITTDGSPYIELE